MGEKHACCGWDGDRNDKEAMGIDCLPGLVCGDPGHNYVPVVSTCQTSSWDTTVPYTESYAKKKVVMSILENEQATTT